MYSWLSPLPNFYMRSIVVGCVCLFVLCSGNLQPHGIETSSQRAYFKNISKTKKYFFKDWTLLQLARNMVLHNCVSAPCLHSIYPDPCSYHLLMPCLPPSLSPRSVGTSPRAKVSTFPPRLRNILWTSFMEIYAITCFCPRLVSNTKSVYLASASATKGKKYGIHAPEKKSIIL